MKFTPFGQNVRFFGQAKALVPEHDGRFLHKTNFIRCLAPCPACHVEHEAAASFARTVRDSVSDGLRTRRSP
jgi:hypothetical protein